METVLGFVRDYQPSTWALIAIVIIAGSGLVLSLLVDRRQPQQDDYSHPGAEEEIPLIYTAPDVKVVRLYSITEHHPDEGYSSFQQFEVLEKEGGRFRIAVFSRGTPDPEHCSHAFGGWAESLPSDRIIRKADLSPR